MIGLRVFRQDHPGRREDESKDFYLIREKEMIEKMERGWNKALREGSARVPCSCKLKKTRSHQELRK